MKLEDHDVNVKTQPTTNNQIDDSTIRSLLIMLHEARKEFPTHKTYRASTSVEVSGSVKVSYAIIISSEGL